MGLARQILHSLNQIHLLTVWKCLNNFLFKKLMLYPFTAMCFMSFLHIAIYFILNSSRMFSYGFICKQWGQTEWCYSRLSKLCLSWSKVTIGILSYLENKHVFLREKRFYIASVAVVQLWFSCIGLALYWLISATTVFFLIWLQVRNSKASGYCLDQGAEEDDKAILYPCHGMSSQVNG